MSAFEVLGDNCNTVGHTVTSDSSIKSWVKNILLGKRRNLVMLVLLLDVRVCWSLLVVLIKSPTNASIEKARGCECINWGDASPDGSGLRG